MNHFFDIGANVGQTFDDFLTSSGHFDDWHIWCFEPSPRHVPALMAKAATLRDRYRIHICPFGVRGKTTIADFYPKDDPRGDSFEEFCRADHDQKNLWQGYQLLGLAVGLGDFIGQFIGADEKVILKLDCEGSEYDILPHLASDGPALAKVREILVEFHQIDQKGVMGQPELRREYERLGKPLRQWMF